VTLPHDGAYARELSGSLQHEVRLRYRVKKTAQATLTVTAREQCAPLLVWLLSCRLPLLWLTSDDIGDIIEVRIIAKNFTQADLFHRGNRQRIFKIELGVVEVEYQGANDDTFTWESHMSQAQHWREEGDNLEAAFLVLLALGREDIHHFGDNAVRRVQLLLTGFDLLEEGQARSRFDGIVAG